MRLSTSLIYAQGYDAIARQQGDLLRTQQQIAAGKRIATPADDPIGAARAQTLTQSVADADRYGANITGAASALQGNDALLQQVGDLLQRVRTLAVNGGSGSLSAADRASIATDIAGEAQDLLGLANSRDAAGKFVFSGLSVDVQPFTVSGSGVTYNGDQGQHEVQVASSRTLPVNLDGSSVFMEGSNGDGVVAMRAAAGNTGRGVIAPGAIVTPGAPNGHTFTLQFSVAAGATTYDVLDDGVTVSAGVPYVPGSAIGVGGMETTITGAPANGDAFTLAPSARQSLFTTLADLVATLNTPASAAGAQAKVTNGIAAALQDLDRGLDNILTRRATVGAQLRELDTLGESVSARSLQDQQSLSALTDLDYNKALSDFARQQVALQAAQATFAKVSGLSLFDFLRS